MQSTIDQQPISSDGSLPKSKPDHETILFGQDPAHRIVAIEPSEKSLNIWQRDESGSILKSSEPFKPWLLLAAPNSLLKFEPSELEGEGFRNLYEFESW